MPDYLVGTGGWAYFKVPNRSSLSAYAEVFNFVEVNYTFYEYPDIRLVERWRRSVPERFTFAVRCHQDLTHRIGLRPVDEAFRVFEQMLVYCRVLNSPFLVLETPMRHVFGKGAIDATRDFFDSVSFGRARVVWEVRAPITESVVSLMRDFGLVHCVDLSVGEPCFWSDVVYSRLFGRGVHNAYQFVDEELEAIDQKILKSEAKVVTLSYHGIRMSTDAARFLHYKRTGEFFPVTPFTGLDSVRSVLSEDAVFPTSREELARLQGWKVVDLTAYKRVHLGELLSKIPNKVYGNVNEVVEALEVV